ncbi:hypothetical protein [uncultured Algimonas sp.]|uniref:hypothetical protein n=1 Tax=uncultured Algimonas sp. TaxID=1547920 RepID=UPI00261F0102|nr:hypothetical protein [uncultured Algimonas sp.]
MTNIRASGSNAVNGYLGCRPTPCSISVPRKREPIVTVSMDGYQPIKFKVTSTVATGSSAVRAGSLVAGLPPGTHVYAGKADLLNRIPSGSRVVTGAIFSFGTGAVLDMATGANKNLAPNPVTVVFAPVDSAQAIDVPRTG